MKYYIVEDTEARFHRNVYLSFEKPDPESCFVVRGEIDVEILWFDKEELSEKEVLAVIDGTYGA